MVGNVRPLQQEDLGAIYPPDSSSPAFHAFDKEWQACGRPRARDNVHSRACADQSELKAHGKEASITKALYRSVGVE